MMSNASLSFLWAWVANSLEEVGRPSARAATQVVSKTAISARRAEGGK